MNLEKLLTNIPIVSKLMAWLVPDKNWWTSVTAMVGALWMISDQLSGIQGLPAFALPSVTALALFFHKYGALLMALGIAKKVGETKKAVIDANGDGIEDDPAAPAPALAAPVAGKTVAGQAKVGG